MRPLVDWALEACLGKGGSTLFATPDDSSGGGVLGWLTPLQGIPVPRANLSPNDRLALDNRLSQAAGAIQQEASQRALSQSGDDRILGGFLQNIADSLAAIASGGYSPLPAFMVGASPVVVGWGFVPAQARAQADTPAVAPAAAPAATPAQTTRTIVQTTHPADEADEADEDDEDDEDEASSKGCCLWKLLKWGIESMITLAIILVIACFAVPELRNDYVYPVIKPGKGFRIPKGGDPKDISFMEGCWEAGSGIVNSRTKLPVSYEFCFYKYGMGNYTRKELNKNGWIRDTCKGKAYAERDKDAVVILGRSTTCRSELKHDSFRLRCKNHLRIITDCTFEGKGYSFTTTLHRAD
ncbi:MAG: hypothetical protein LBF40_01565 [Deltaproteobacteria bacterium]|nr:hypothetical protein [Deltaproteobacteria bacterium]